MNSFPTELNPWFAVVKHRSLGMLGEAYYFRSSPINAEEKYEPWTEDKKEAQVFLSLRSATVIAAAEGAEVLVIWNRERLREWGRG